MSDITNNNSPNISYKPLKMGDVFTDSNNLTDNSIFDLDNWLSIENRTFSFDKPNQVSVYDVAEYIVRKLGELTTMKLHKLLYYCQAWSLVWDEKSLFQEEIEAWANGPVVRELFSYHRGEYSIVNISIGNPNVLNSKQIETIDSVLNYYGDKSAQWLIELTHLEEPWKQARKGLHQTERGSRIITYEAMTNYYSSL